MDQVINFKSLVNSLIFSGIGLMMFALGLYIVEKSSPGQFRKEIIEEHNIALAIIVGSAAIGISLIIAFAIHG